MKQHELIELLQNEILGSGEVCELLEVSRNRLKEFVKEGRLVVVKDLGTQRLFLRSNVEALKVELLKSPYRKKETKGETE